MKNGFRSDIFIFINYFICIGNYSVNEVINNVVRQGQACYRKMTKVTSQVLYKKNIEIMEKTTKIIKSSDDF